MGSDSTAAAMLAAGSEAMLDAAFCTGEFPPARDLLESAWQRAHADGDRVTEAAALTRLGMLAHFAALADDPARADPQVEERLFTAALTLQHQTGDLAGAAESLFGIGLVHEVLRGDWDTALSFYRDALTLAEGSPDELLLSEVHRHLGFFHVYCDGDTEAGRRHLRMSQVLRERHGDPRHIATGTLALGEAELAAGHAPEAARLLREAVNQSRAARLSPQRVHWAEQALRTAEDHCAH